MKQIIPLLLVVLFISSLKVQAQTATYYVNAATGLDTNTGTTEANAWSTLNPSKWSGDCKIYIANGEYLITEKINVTLNVELIGTSKDLVSLMGSSDEEFPNDGRGGLTMTSGIFELAEGKTLKIEGLTMKNIRRDVGTEAILGGAIRTQTGSYLTIRDVNMHNCIVLNGGGGAIFANGNIDIENVTFENCSATSYGAALSLKDSLQNKAVYRLEKVHFLNNNSSSDIVYVQSPKTEFSLNNCLFKGNSRLSDYGAVLRLSSNSGYLNAKITNSSFVDNPGVKSGVISIPTNSANTRTIDLKIVNCTFTNNTLSQGPHGAVYSMGGSSTTTLTGTIAFVNNTIFNNGRADDVTGTTSCLYFPDTSVNFF